MDFSARGDFTLFHYQLGQKWWYWNIKRHPSVHKKISNNIMHQENAYIIATNVGTLYSDEHLNAFLCWGAKHWIFCHVTRTASLFQTLSQTMLYWDWTVLHSINSINSALTNNKSKNLSKFIILSQQCDTDGFMAHCMFILYCPVWIQRHFLTNNTYT